LLETHYSHCIKASKSEGFLIRESGVDVVPEFCGIRDTEINHGGFEALVAQPVLDCTDWYAGLVPACGASLAKTVQIEVFTNRTVFAGDFNLFSLLVPSFSDRRSTLATIQARALGNALQLSKEVIVRPAFFVDEDPALMRSFLVPALEQRSQ
jgi:hypothetical protein